MNISVLPASTATNYLTNLTLFSEANNLKNITIKKQIGSTNKSKSILIVDYVDLFLCADIQWHTVNVVFLETFEQAMSAKSKFDVSKSYIFVAESVANRAMLRDAFADLHVIDIFSIFYEVFDYGKQIFDPTSQITELISAHDTIPEFDFFCLLGRRTNTRKQLFYQLNALDLSKSLVRYHGSLAENCGAPDLDSVKYQAGSFYQIELTHKNINPGKIFQIDLYKKFKFEVQHETDPNNQKGWQFPEYHITEKTLKPLVAGFPCLMFAAQKYHECLKSFGIDLGLGKFNLDFDQIYDNNERLIVMTEQLPNILKSDYVPPTQEAIDNNFIGLKKLSRLSMQNFKNLYTTLDSL